MNRAFVVLAVVSLSAAALVSQRRVQQPRRRSEMRGHRSWCRSGI
jgi:hypothetical protein